MSINRVTISGNLTSDPELRRTKGGSIILTFCVAVNESRKNEAGEWEDYANFVVCVMFGKRAESVANYIGKGSKVSIDGKLRYSTWDKDSQKRSKLEVIVDEIEFMSKGEKKPKQEPLPVSEPQHGVYDDDIPF